MVKSCDECYREGFQHGVDAAVEQAERGDLQFQVEQRKHNTHNTHMGEERITARLAFEDTPQEKKKKRKVSKYQKEFGKQMKKLKKAHPKTKVTKLMSRGHTAARKALGMKRKR